jgi:hypothetical protein
MRILFMLALTAITLTSYAQKGKKKQVNEDEYPVKMRIVLGKPLDSLLTLNYLIPEAVEVINGKRLLKDDKITMSILEKSTGGDAESRPLYIHILMYANWYATEAGLADSLGKFNINLMQRFPKDVLRYFKKAETDKRIEDAQKAFNYNIAFELNNSDDPLAAYDAFEEKVLKTYKSKETKPVDEILKEVRKLMKRK